MILAAQSQYMLHKIDKKYSMYNLTKNKQLSTNKSNDNKELEQQFSITNNQAFSMFLIKDGLPLKTKNVHIHLYFIATKYLWINALVEYTCIDNWTRFYSLVIIYQKRQK